MLEIRSLRARLPSTFATLALSITPALAQSTTDNSDLFPENEQVLRLGNDTNNIVILPFIQLDGGYTAIEPDGAFGDVDEEWDANVRLAQLYVFLNGDWVDGTLAFNFHDTDFACANGSLGVQGELTGERHGNSPSPGTFGRVVPIDPVDDGGTGAIRIGARIDYLDLSDLGPDAGTQIGTSLMVNDYLAKHLTATADYAYARLIDRPNEGADVHALTAACTSPTSPRFPSGSLHHMHATAPSGRRVPRTERNLSWLAS